MQYLILKIRYIIGYVGKTDARSCLLCLNQQPTCERFSLYNAVSFMRKKMHFDLSVLNLQCV